MHTTGYYSSVNKNDIMKFVSKWHIIGLTQCWTLQYQLPDKTGPLAQQ